MGNAVPEECVSNALQEDECTWTLSSGQNGVQVWEEWRPIVELMEEDEEEVDKEADVGKGPPHWRLGA